nr:serine/threonine-protein kinase spk-1 [Quercus suber]
MREMAARLVRCLPRNDFDIRRKQYHHITRRLYHHRGNLNLQHPPLEEQTLPRFYEKRYLPVAIGQPLNERYHILAKLGYGAYSTVWLARDRKTNQYTSIKVFVRDDSETSPMANEIRVLRHIATCSHEHAGATAVRLADDIFEVNGHSCLAMKPQACTLQQLQYSFADHRIPREFVMAVAMRLLACVNWLQLDCGVVHTGT